MVSAIGRANLRRLRSGQLVGDIPQNPQPLFTRADPQVIFDWLDGAPRADLNDDDFGVRWTGTLTAPVTGTYQLGAAGKNAFELYLDGKQLVAMNTDSRAAGRICMLQSSSKPVSVIRFGWIFTST